MGVMNAGVDENLYQFGADCPKLKGRVTKHDSPSPAVSRFLFREFLLGAKAVSFHHLWQKMRSGISAKRRP